MLMLHRTPGSSLTAVAGAMQTQRLPLAAYGIVLKSAMPTVIRSDTHLRPLTAGARQLHQQTLPPTDNLKPKRQSTLGRLGATRRVKIVVLIFLAIYGTMEGIFYTTWLYRYFTNKKTEEGE